MTLEPLFVVALLFALAPFVLVLLTCFTKLAVVLSLLRYALGVPQVPSDRVVSTVALALTFYIMAPTVADAWSHVEPWLEARSEVTATEPTVEELTAVAEDAIQPMLDFAARHAEPAEVDRMLELTREVQGTEEVTKEDASVLLPAFLISELNEAFIIGAMLFIPFVALDLFIANLLISLGLVAIRVTTVTVPMKLALFVLADGWYLLVRGLAMGYA